MYLVLRSSPAGHYETVEFDGGPGRGQQFVLDKGLRGNVSLVGLGASHAQAEELAERDFEAVKPSPDRLDGGNNHFQYHFVDVEATVTPVTSMESVD